MNVYLYFIWFRYRPSLLEDSIHLGVGCCSLSGICPIADSLLRSYPECIPLRHEIFSNILFSPECLLFLPVSLIYCQSSSSASIFFSLPSHQPLPQPHNTMPAAVRERSPSSPSGRAAKKSRNNTEHAVLSSINHPSAEQVAAYREKYVNAAPFKHAVLSDLLSDDLVCARALRPGQGMKGSHS